MYLAIDIQWCKYKKKLNYGKILELPGPTPLSNSLLGVIVGGMHAAIQNFITLHIIFFYFMQLKLLHRFTQSITHIVYWLSTYSLK